MTPALTKTPKSRGEPASFKSNLWAVTLGAAVLCCGFELWWFSRTCFNEIDFDGMAYTGIARHLREGDFHTAINAFRSPLLSWLIAAFRWGNADYVHIGKLVSMGSFMLSLALTYALGRSLWRSRLAGSLAALLFALARGFAAAAVEVVTPDFLFAALALIYFLQLLRALRQDRWQDWLLLGAIHGVAFLAKAFALPWLAVCTVAALALSGKPWRTTVTRLAAAALLPALIASGWAGVLHAKYGVFTTGSQFKANLLLWTVHAIRDHRDPTYAVLTNLAPRLDAYGVMDPMPPGSWTWTYHSDIKTLVPAILRAEEHNVPLVLKEILIVATPGGLLAYGFALVAAFRRRFQYPAEWRFVAVSAIASAALVGAYSMLVFDPRYLFPLVPLLLLVASSFLAGDSEFHLRWRRVCQALVIAGMAVSLTYRSSPFRTLTRDFQVSCYDAGNRLKAHGQLRIVSLGSGPFPEHGVGWEAGYKAAYFGGARLVATVDALPDTAQDSRLMADMEEASPNAILVWGRPDDPRRAALLQSPTLLGRSTSVEKIVDPVLGEVGVVIFWSPDRPSSGRPRVASWFPGGGNLVITVN
ncbi:MAG TPA: glycosyltransferase family 39 protein [Terriglobales bacterium]|nr:glycosyltransferase family 39 protein [Terriglobales bacterium]